MRRLTIGTFLVAALLALAVGSIGLLSRGGGNDAEAVTGILEPGDPDTGGPGLVANLWVDTDTTGNTLGSTTSSALIQGTVEPCIGGLIVGSTFDVDFIFDEVDPVDSSAGGSFDLVYSGAVLQVNAVSHPGGSTPFTVPAIYPDSSGALTVAWANFGAGDTDGEVLFGRVTFEVIGLGSTLLDVDPSTSGVNNSVGAAIPGTPTSAWDGQVFAGAACPTSTDLSATITAITGADPIAVSNNEPYTVDVTVAEEPPNAEPGPIDYDLTIDLGPGTSAAFLADCTTTPAMPIVVSGTIAADPGPQSNLHSVPFDIHCTDPSPHDFEIEATVVRDGGVADTVPANNTDTAAANLDVTAVSDIDITAQSITPATVQFFVDNNIDDDGDTTDDEDPIELGIAPIDNDGDTVANEDGGHVVPITIAKTITNLGPYGPNPVLDTLTVLQGNPNAAACGISLSPVGPFVGGPLTPSQQTNIPFPGSSPISFTIWLHCGPSGWGYDDDGDGIDTNGDTLPDAFIDEDIPDGADNDGDTKVDEDGPVALPTIVAQNCANSKDIHISDPNQEPTPLALPAVVLQDTCELTTLTLQGVHPFSPSGVITIDEFDNGNFTAPVDNDCLVTVPCKLQSVYTIPDGWGLAAQGNSPVDTAGAHHQAGDANDQGGGPLAGVAILEQLTPNGAFSLTPGTAIPDGAITTEISATATLRLIPGTGCATPGVLAFALADGDLPGVGAPDTPNAPGLGAEDAALASPFTWPGALDAVVSYIVLTNPTAVLWARNVGFTDVDGPGGLSPIPINELIFDLSGGAGLGPWLHFNHIGDPDFDADGLYDLTLDGDDDGDTIPDAMDPDSDNDGTANSLELAQCAPLGVTQISLGTSQGFDYSGVGGPVVPGGTVLRVCNIINPINPPGSIGHTDAQRFTREDIGTTTTILSQVGCSGENDAAASICKDETPGDLVFPAPCPDATQPGVDNDADTQIDEDPTLNGIDEDGDGIDGEDPIVDIVKASEPQGVTVVFDVENGTVPGDLNVQFSIVGPAACNPTWVGQAGDTVSTATLGSTQTSTITRTEVGMASNEVRYFVRKYIVSCPPGAHNFNVYNNVSSASGLPDPDLNNNQAENQLQVIATADVDGDGVQQPADNCNWTANPNQTDTDSDGIGDACDIDDDDDGIDDGDDDCPLLPEDFDGVDDTDGCPDTDVTVDVDKDETYDVDVSTSVNKTVTITVTNGNYPANVQTNMVAVSTLGACEVRLIAQAGDTYSEFTTDETAPAGDDTLWSQIERVDFFNAGETKIFVRQYTIHCFQNSQHTFELAVDSLPLNPVQEEDLDDNVHKNFPTVTAYKLADLKKVSLVFNNPPASVKVGESFNLTILGTLHNNGPTTAVNYSDSLSIDGPADCTWGAGNPFPYNTGQNGTMNTSVNTPISSTIAVVCSEQSNHIFTSANNISVTSLHVRDPQTGNNTIGTQATIVVNADADVKVTSVVVNAPADGDVNVPFNVSVDTTLHNNGPETPVNVDGSVSISVPADCTKVPAGAQTINDQSLVASTAVVITKNWSVTCTANSDHPITGAASATVDQVHVVDPITANNSGNGADTIAIFKAVEKTICDVYVGPSPVPAAPTGPAAGCPGVDPWSGGPGVISVQGLTVTVVTDDLDYSSQAVTVKRTLTMTPTPNGPNSPQGCGVDIAQQIFTEAEPAGLSTAGTIAEWEITLPMPVHDGEPNWCEISYNVTKEIDELHVEDGPVTGDLSQTVTFIVARDTDGDGVFDNALGDLDNCKLVANPGQEDSNGNGTGDACDSEVDVLEKYITVLGPAAVNLSDNNGRYMWVIGEMGNASDDTQQVQITITISATPPLPAGCTEEIDLILPGQDTFLMLAHEQKFQVYRVRYECHSPATQQVITLDIEKCIDLLPSDSQDDDGDTLVDEDSRDGVDDDGDSEDGEDPPNPDDNPGNDCQSTSKQVIIDQP